MRKKGKTWRPTSKFPPEVRAHMIAETVRDVQNKHLSDGDTAHLVCLLVHGHDPAKRYALEIAQPHMDAQTVDELLKEAMSDFGQWGKSEKEESALVDRFSSAIMGAVQNIRQTDRAFGETAFLCVHPSGAACLSYFSDQGRDTHFMRAMVFHALQLRYERPL